MDFMAQTAVNGPIHRCNKDSLRLRHWTRKGDSTHIVVLLLALLCDLQVSGAVLLKEGDHLLEIEPPSGTIHVARFGMDINGRFWWEPRIHRALEKC